MRNYVHVVMLRRECETVDIVKVFKHEADAELYRKRYAGDDIIIRKFPVFDLSICKKPPRSATVLPVR